MSNETAALTILHDLMKLLQNNCLVSKILSIQVPHYLFQEMKDTIFWKDGEIYFRQYFKNYVKTLR